MFGATTEFFFRHLLGIQQAEHSRGYKHVVFRPSVLLSPAHLAICAIAFSSRSMSTVGPQNSPSSRGWIAITTSGFSTFLVWINLKNRFLN